MVVIVVVVMVVMIFGGGCSGDPTAAATPVNDFVVLYHDENDTDGDGHGCNTLVVNDDNTRIDTHFANNVHYNDDDNFATVADDGVAISILMSITTMTLTITSLITMTT